MKKIVILGSTGSIGKQTLEIVREFPKEFSVVGLSCDKNINVLNEQVKEFNPRAVAVADERASEGASFDCQMFKGNEGLKQLAILQEADLILNAVVGSIGIIPTASALKAGKIVALANKESLVAAGDVIMKLAKPNQLLPVDSEHSAIFQCLQGEPAPRSVTLTCSGGPFRNASIEEMRRATVNDALNHPKWKMGGKISIDSATLMNKGLEVIEAHHLFNLAYEHIKVIVHPESIIHSLVEFQDTSVKAQLGYPDMRLPIQYALSYPRRLGTNFKSLNLVEMHTLNFQNPDFNRFPSLGYAYEAGKIGGTMPAVLNAANEAAVKLFMEGKITFMQIPDLVNQAMKSHHSTSSASIEEIDALSKRTIRTILEKHQ